MAETTKTRPLSDDDVYELLHQAWLMFNDRTVRTPLGQDVIAIMLRQIETMQKAMIIVREGDGSSERSAPRRETE